MMPLEIEALRIQNRLVYDAYKSIYDQYSKSHCEMLGLELDDLWREHLAINRLIALKTRQYNQKGKAPNLFEIDVDVSLLLINLN